MSNVDNTRQRLVEGRLLKAADADEQITRWRSETGAESDSSDALVKWLVGQQLLTEFQAEAVREGHDGPYMLGPYRVFERMAVGRLGNIFRAVHEELDQPVSLKVFPSRLKDDSEKVARMHREFRTAVELDDPNVVRSFHMGCADGIYFLAFEDLHGETLQDLLDDAGALPFPTACRLISDAARGLSHVHEKGLVHRDVCPANMWVTVDDRIGRLKLMELGAVLDAMHQVVTDEQSAVTTNESVVGTFDYMAPEQARDPHAADHRSDIYSLGCTLYHCLTGQPPFEEKNVIRLVACHANEMPAPVTDKIADIPESLAETVQSMLAKTPDDRFQSASDVIWSLEQHVKDAADQESGQLGVNPKFAKWLKKIEGRVDLPTPETRSPQLAQFLHWLADGRPRRN